MRPLLLALSFLQTVILAPAQMAPGHCQAHAPRAAAQEHASGHHGHDGQQAPQPASDCTHCPPADCARHQACAQTATAVAAESAPLRQRWAASPSSHVAPRALISTDQDPPTHPPRLIA